MLCKRRNTLFLVNFLLLILDIVNAVSLLDFDDFGENLAMFSFIQNGWIEHDEQTNTFAIKCKKNYRVNSNSSLVMRKLRPNGLITWVPINGYLMEKNGLCAKTCTFQAYLQNGIIRIYSTAKNNIRLIQHHSYPDNENSTSHPKTLNAANMQLFENTQVRYECLDGYTLKSTPPHSFQKKKKHFLIEKCEPKSDSFNFFNLNYLNTFDYDEDHHLPFKSYRPNSFHHYECRKYCEPFRVPNYDLSKLFMVPLKREAFSYGEKLFLQCNEGFITTLTNENEYVNRFELECESNGKWYLKDNTINATVNTLGLEIKRLPICFSLDKINLKSMSENPNQKFSNFSDLFLRENFSYSELNVRTFSMIILFCGLLFSIVILCLTIINFLSKRFDFHRNLHLATTQSDQLVMCSGVDSNFQQVGSNNLENLINRSMPIQQGSHANPVGDQEITTNLPSAPHQSLMVVDHDLVVMSAHLPSYEEATAHMPRRGNFNFQLNSSTSETLVFERTQANSIK